MNIPASNIAGAVWPAVPSDDAAPLFALMYQLEQSQWWPPETLERFQFSQLELLVAHAVATVPFYRERLAPLSALGRGELTGKRWQQIPILTRGEVQDSGDALLSRAIPPSHGPVVTETSSGSTGRAVTIHATAVNSLFNNAFNLRRQLWHGRDFSAKASTIRALEPGTALPPQGARGENWAPGYRTGPLALLNLVGSTVGEQIDWLAREAPAYLLTFPSNLEALARRCEETAATLPSLRGLATFGEHLEPDLHEICQRVFGVPLMDMYSATEVGAIAIQCPEHAHYHVQAEGVLVEILNEDGSRCQPGDVGRVVVSDLHNFAMPLLRYDIGDYAEVGDPCSCGRELPVLTRILGRERNMLKLRDGEAIWPRVGKPLRAIAGVTQHQLIQHSYDDIEVLLATATPLPAEDEAKLRDTLLDYLGHPFVIDFTYVDAIPRPPNQKFEWVKSQVA